VPVDQATRDLVSRDGLGRTLFVEAGAGTGKTTQLVDRIANLVLHEGVRLVNIAAITFTEAAAAELQARIRVKFERGAATSEGDERRRCLDALADADLAAISTLHGFASRLLNEYAVDAGLPPRVTVLDEVSSQLAHEDRWARFVDRLYDDPGNEPLLERAHLVGIALEARYLGQPTLKDVAADLNDNWDRLAPIVAAERPPIGPVDFSAFDDAVVTLAKAADECSDRTDRLHLRIVEDLLPEMQVLVDHPDPDIELQQLAMVAREPWTTGNIGRKASWGRDPKAIRDLVREVNDAAGQVVARAADEVLRNLLVLVADEVLAAAQQRREEGGLEFHDLLVLAREMLRTSPSARAGLHERYTHILLDEFQDTDPIPIELAMRIAASITGGGADSWKELDVDDGRLFFVGDPKQSIYRFRRADIELFLDARDRFGPDGTWARLTTNFRTVAPVLAWVNAYFASVMAEEEAGKQPRYEPLSAWRDPSDLADHRPIMLGGPHPDPKVKAGTLRAAEADSIAAVIADVARRPDAWPVHDEATGAWRPAELRDVTILVPTRTSVPYLRAALEDHDVPYRLATGTLVYGTQEVRDALAALAAIDDPTDELSLVAALRSPLYACSDVDLFTFRRAGGRWDLRRDPLRRPETSADRPPDLVGGHAGPSAPSEVVAPADGDGGAAVVEVAAPVEVEQLGFAFDEPTAVAAVATSSAVGLAVDAVPVDDGPGEVASDRPVLGDDHPVVVALAHLRSLWEDRWWQSPSALLERLLRERQAFLLGFGDRRPTEVWRRLRFVVDQARVFEEAEGGDLRSFLEWAALQGVDGAKVHEPLLPETDDDAVQILTIHGAKGLEFPITILSGMTTKTASPRYGVSLVWDGDRPEVRMRKGLATANHEPRFDLELEMDVHEKTRLLYVATTRARDHLVVSCHHKELGSSKPDTYASQLWSFFGDHPELWQPFDEPASLPAHVLADRSDTEDETHATTAPEQPGDRDRWIAEREALLAPHRRPSVVSATAIAHAVHGASVSDGRDDLDRSGGSGGSGVDGVDGVDPDLSDVDGYGIGGVDLDVLVGDDGGSAALAGPTAIPQRRQGRAGSAIGRAVHATLQVIDLVDPAGPPDLEALVERECDLEAIVDLAPQAVARVRSALASDSVREAARSPHHRELYVAAPVGDRVIEGYVDLLIETVDGLVVVDYKTDSASSEAEIDAALRRYELQGAAYALALEVSTGLPVHEVRFVFCRPNGPVERRVTDLPGAMARVRAHLAAGDGGDPLPASASIHSTDFI
jgi:ATP-dependent exoDNAse (exonuclease V) beta subunit